MKYNSTIRKAYLEGIIHEIHNYVCLGLGSENPIHWEAALNEILTILNRTALEKELS